MRRFWTLLAALFWLGCSTPAAAWTHGGGGGGGGGSSPLVTPGSSQPTLSTPDASAATIGNVSFNTLTASSHGNPADYGYGLRGFMYWNALQLSELGVPGVNTTVHIGLRALHMPTDVELAAGLDSNIVAVKVSCDGNVTWTTIPAPSANPDSGMTDWNFQIQTGSWADGLHHCEAIGVPATGPDILNQGPVRDEWNNNYDSGKAVAMRIDTGAAGSNTADQILTVTTLNGQTVLNWRGANANPMISYGHSVTMKGVAPNTFIDGTSQTNKTACVAATGSNCTGSGDTGTYHVTVAQSTHGFAGTAQITTVGGVGVLNVSAVTSGSVGYDVLSGAGVTAGTRITANSTDNTSTNHPCGGVDCTGNGGTGTYALNAAQTVGSEAMTTTEEGVLGDQTSFWFITNAGNTCNSTFCRPVIFQNASTGSDGATGADSAHPVQTIGKAMVNLAAADPRSFQKGVYGGYVCQLGGLSSPVSGSTPSAPAAKVGHAAYISANDPRCGSVAGDPGGAGIAWTGTAGTDSNYLPLHTLFQNINFTGAGSPATTNPGLAWYLSAQGVTQKSTKVNNGGLLGSGAYWCSESVAWFGSDGACSGALEVRNVTAKYAVNADGQHDVPRVLNSTFDGIGTTMTWVRGTMGTNNVITFTILPGELSGYTLAQILDTTQVYNATTSPDVASSYCFSATVPIGVAISVSGNTVTFTGSTGFTGNCANGQTVYLYFDGFHTDLLQLAAGNVFGNVDIDGNSFNLNYRSGGQGLFLEDTKVSGLHVANNAFYYAASGSLLSVNGDNDLVTLFNNTFGGSGSYRMDVNGTSLNETLSKDQCLTGSYPMFAGLATFLRRLTAASNPCYANNP